MPKKFTYDAVVKIFSDIDENMMPIKIGNLPFWDKNVNDKLNICQNHSCRNNWHN